MNIKRMLRAFAKVPILGRLTLGIYRLSLGVRPILISTRKLFIWLFKSKEYTNFTYDLTEKNKRHLASFLTAATQCDHSTALAYLDELENDVELKEHIKKFTCTSSEHHFADEIARYGRRIGWYAVVRIAKPRIVVETGVEKGLGSCVLAAALLRNQEEGFPGFYYGTDIQPKAGYLFRGKYAEVGKILFGDSIESLEQLDEKIDVFINDSDHSAEYEANEYQTIENNLSDTSYIIADNAHVSTKLLEFALRTGRRFLFFKEEPKDHWYPGGGIGIAFNK